jgi:hypothetical protein
MKKRLVSVPVKLLVLVVGALLLLSVVFSYFTLSQLNQELKQYKDGTLRKGNAQFSVQNNVLREMRRSWLESFSDIVRLKEDQNFDVLVQGFSAQFDTLQMNQNVENVWIVTAENKKLYLSSPIPSYVEKSIQRVLQLQQPVYQLYCSDQCYQLIAVPVLNGKGDMAIVAMAVSLVDMIYSINQALENESAIISFPKSSKRVSSNSKGNVALADANFISSSDTQLVSRLFNGNPIVVQANTLKKQGIEVGLEENSYLINLILIASTTEQDYYLVLIDDVTIFTLKYQQNRKQFLVFSLMILIALAIAVHFVASPLTRRLLVLSDVLPLLAKKEFDQFRQVKIKREGTFIDELDI